MKKTLTTFGIVGIIVGFCLIVGHSTYAQTATSSEATSSDQTDTIVAAPTTTPDVVTTSVVTTSPDTSTVATTSSTIASSTPVFFVPSLPAPTLAPTPVPDTTATPDFSTVQSSIEASVALQIKHYTSFADNVPSSITSDDQTLLTGELTGAISRMQTSLQALPSAADIPSLFADLEQGSATDITSDKLLKLKMSLFSTIFRPAHTTLHNRINSVASSTTITFIQNSAISSDLIHQIATLSSIKDFQTLRQDVSAELSSQTSSTTVQ